MADTVKCKGCGCEVWIGSKLTDGYCHDCTVRGRHLPEDADLWPESPKQKKKPKPRPFTPPPPPSKPAIRRGFRLPRLRLKWWGVLLAVWLGWVVISNFAAIGEIVANVFTRTDSQTAAIESIRRETPSNFYSKGEKIPAGELSARQAEISAFIESGASYRVSGAVTYAFVNYIDPGSAGAKVSARFNVEASYNGELDVCKFEIANQNTSPKLAEYRIADGVYYIVKENGATYVLTYSSARKAVPVSEDSAAYDFLTRYLMEAVIDPGFIGNAQTDSRALRDGAYYSHAFLDTGYSVFSSHRTELRTYKDMPVYYYSCNKDMETGLEREFIFNYYYDNIPRDKPDMADYEF